MFEQRVDAAAWQLLYDINDTAYELYRDRTVELSSRTALLARIALEVALYRASQWS